MFQSDPAPFSNHREPSLYLDYGADAHFCGDRGVELCEKGMHFCARWRFEIGAVIAVSLVQKNPPLAERRVALEGMVVECLANPVDGTFETTLFFFEFPEALREVLREFSCQLPLRVRPEAR